MQNTANTPRNWTYILVATIVKGYLIGALAISFNHIITAGHMLGLHGWQSYTVPFAFDGLAILGMIGRTERVLQKVENPESFKRLAVWFQVVCGSLSLASNVFAGQNAGERIYGVIIVATFLAAEKFAEMMKARKAGAVQAITPADVQAAVNQAVAATLAQAAIDTQAAVEAAIAKADRARKAKERRDAKRIEALAPVSPATVAEIEDAFGDAGYAPRYF